MDVEKVVREYLPDVIHMSLGTCVDNKPWVCELHFAYDNDLNLYFITRSNSRHGKEIAKNPKVAGNIVTQHKKDEAARGVYFEGKAELLEDVTESDVAFKSYTSRSSWPKRVEEVAQEGYAFYKISVENYFVFDNRENKPGKKFELKWGKK